MFRRWLLVPTMVLSLALGLLGACGNASGGEKVASLGDDTSDTTTADGSRADGSKANDPGGGGGDEVTDEEREEAMLAFAQCMREHGVDVPDPSGDGGVMVFGGPDSEDGSEPQDRETLDAAQEACEPELEGIGPGPGDMTDEERAEMEDQMLAFAQCMRDHGVDMPDPEFGEDGRVQSELPDIDPNSDEFQEAQDACSEELGTEGGFVTRGPGGPGGGPGGASDEQGPSLDSSGEGSDDAE